MYNRPFRWWVQSVMPLVFDDSLSYYEVLAKLTKYIEGLTGDVEQIEKILGTIEGIEDVTQFTEFLERIQAEIGNLENLQTDTKVNLVSAINEVALKADIAYWKPPTGIPESDLSQEVKDKLNRTGEATKYIINNKELKAAPNNNSLSELGIGTYTVPSGGIPWDTLSQDVKDRINAGGGGTGGTTDYTDLNNKPQINGHTLNAGNNTSESLGLGTYSKPGGGIPESDLSAEVQEKLNTSGGIADNQQSFVASRDYEAGELVYINGVLYKTKYKILAGTTMIPGNNIETTDISAELEKINSDIEALQSGSGPDSWNLTDTVQSYSNLEIVDFFEYFNCIGGENYNFIVEPVDPANAASYFLDICKRDGTVALSQHVIHSTEYMNRKRFTFVPTDSGEYYCRFYRNAGGYATTISPIKVTIEYTQSQGMTELWTKVNQASQLEPRVEAVETLVGQHTLQIAELDGLANDVDDIQDDVSSLTDRVDNISNALMISDATPTFPEAYESASFETSSGDRFYKWEDGVLKVGLVRANNSSTSLAVYYGSADLNLSEIIYPYDSNDPPYVIGNCLFDYPAAENTRVRLELTYYTPSLPTTMYNITAVTESGDFSVNTKEIFTAAHASIDDSNIEGVAIRGVAASNLIAGAVSCVANIYGFSTQSQASSRTVIDDIEDDIENLEANDVLVNESIEDINADINELNEAVDSLLEKQNDSDIVLPALLARNALPAYYTSEPENPASFDDIEYLEKVYDKIPAGKGYMIITDTHWDSENADNAQNSPMLMNYFKCRTGFNQAIFVGDFINRRDNKYRANQVMQDFATKFMSVFGDKFYTAIGNHDMNLANYIDGTHTPEEIEALYLPYNIIYDCLFKPYKDKVVTFWDSKFYTYSTNTSNRTTTWTESEETNGDVIRGISNDPTKYAELEAYYKMTYYLDDPVTKTRFVFLMCMGKPDYGAAYDLFGDDKIAMYTAWLYQTFLHTPEGYDIAFFTHAMGDPYATTTQTGSTLAVMSLMLMGLKLTINKRIYNSNVGNENMQVFAPAKQLYLDFTNANNVGRAYAVAGHVHRDGIIVANQTSDVRYYDVTRSIYAGETLNQISDSTSGGSNYGSCPIPIIYVSTDAFGRAHDGTDVEHQTPMTENTVTEQAFDIFVGVDSGISLTRVGGGSDRSIEMIWTI